MQRIHLVHLKYILHRESRKVLCQQFINVFLFLDWQTDCRPETWYERSIILLGLHTCDLTRFSVLIKFSRFCQLFLPFWSFHFWRGQINVCLELGDEILCFGYRVIQNLIETATLMWINLLNKNINWKVSWYLYVNTKVDQNVNYHFLFVIEVLRGNSENYKLKEWRTCDRNAYLKFVWQGCVKDESRSKDSLWEKNSSCCHHWPRLG